MNAILAAVVGGALATAAVLGGVSANKTDLEPVAKDKLYTYASE